MILAGDIGGTKTVLGLFAESGHGLEQRAVAEFASQSYRAFAPMLAEFHASSGRPQIEAACLGVAGPVIAGRADLTNLGWTIDEPALAGTLGITRVRLINDLEAAALGMLSLPPAAFFVLNEGTPPAMPRNMAVISAGTGLGEALLCWDGHHYLPIASEGGHADFAPRGDEQIELLRFLSRGVGAKSGGHVSYERVLSGAGIAQVYDFLRARSGKDEPDWLSARLTSGDRSAAITAAAASGEENVCVHTLALFAYVLGAESGNLALRSMALSGVFVAGGIPPKILPELKKGGFMHAFTDKGRFAPLLKSVPVKVALDPRAPLLGAAHAARSL